MQSPIEPPRKEQNDASMSGMSAELGTPQRKETEKPEKMQRESFKEDEEDEDEDFSDDIPMRGSKDSSNTRSARGLRVLSVRVRELVFEKKITTYKEVADELIKELIEEGKMPRDSRNVILILNIVRAKTRRM